MLIAMGCPWCTWKLAGQNLQSSQSYTLACCFPGISMSRLNACYSKAIGGSPFWTTPGWNEHTGAASDAAAAGQSAAWCLDQP